MQTRLVCSMTLRPGSMLRLMITRAMGGGMAAIRLITTSGVRIYGCYLVVEWQSAGAPDGTALILHNNSGIEMRRFFWVGYWL